MVAILRSMLVFTVFIFKINFVFANASVNSQCFFRSRTNSKVQGVRVDQRYKIASVSKIMTSHWAVATLGPNYRFKTGVMVDSSDPQAINVHLAGDMNPYFDLQMLQNLVSELNRLGVTRVQKLTFDENFYYGSSIRFDRYLAHSNGVISSIETGKSLRRDLAQISGGYSLTLAKAQALYGMKLSDNARLSVKEIGFRSSQDYRPNSVVKIFTLASAPLHRFLKEMNRNSNNYVADLIFKKLGDQGAYRNFIKHRLKYDESQVRFVNGSGYPVLRNEEKIYNEASCGATVQVLIDLKQILIKEQLDLEDVLPVAGVNAQGEVSTVSRIYNTGNTRGALIAKTGTINDTISLAGMISAEEGDIFFGIFYKINGTKREVYQAYEGIRNLIEKWTKEFGGKDSIDYKAVAFLPFDKDSVLHPVNDTRWLRNYSSLQNIDDEFYQISLLSPKLNSQPQEAHYLFAPNRQ